ncbi:MAG: ribonuclease Z [Candidatus Asgardarchaeia archaeon]
MSMELIFLGTAGAIPTEERNLISTALKISGHVLLFDCGEDVQRRMVSAKINMNKPLKIFLTHLHGDHINGLPGILFRFSLQGRERGVEIYGPQGTIDYVECISKSMRLNNTYPIKVFEFDRPTLLFENDYYSVSSFKLYHSVECYGYVVKEEDRYVFSPEKALKLRVPKGPLWKKLQMGYEVELGDGRLIKPEMVSDGIRRGKKVVIVGDTKPNEEIISVAKEADVLIHEATYSDDMREEAHMRGHSTAKDAAKVAKKAGVKLLILTHFSARYKDVSLLEKEAREIFEKTIAAHDLMRIKV